MEKFDKYLINDITTGIMAYLNWKVRHGFSTRGLGEEATTLFQFRNYLKKYNGEDDDGTEDNN